jgi:hypothetical protein
MEETMRILIGVAVVLVVAVGCGGGPNPEQEGKHKQEMEQLRLHVDQKIAGLEQKYANVLQMEQRVKNAVEEAEKMSKVNDVVVRLLTAQQEALKDQLRTVQDLLKEMQKK